jgi:choline dehydrogenase-like flavoprotein
MDPNQPETAVARDSVDVLIVGAGVMGAVVAAQIRALRPESRMLMVDAGPPLGAALGHHLHDTPDVDARRDFEARANRANQEKYVRSAAGLVGADLTEVPPGMYTLAEFGNDAGAMPGASIAWNAGGMSVHWAAATPTPYGAEIPAEIDTAEWSADLRTARELLHVHDGPYPSDAFGEAVLAVVDEIFGDASAAERHPQPMPVAMQPQPDGILHRAGPGVVFPPIECGGDDAFALRHSTIVQRILTRDGHAAGAVLRRIDGSGEEVVHAEVVVVCADTMRTPQLLFASGMGGAAVGRYLNEHAFLAGTVLVDLEQLGVGSVPTHLPGEWFTAASWLPHSGDAQPFQAQIMQTPLTDSHGGPDGYSVTMAMYVPTEVRAENRIEFSEHEKDITGLPRMTVYFDHSDADLAMIERARADQARVAARLGSFDPEQPSTLLPAGSSLHYTGTARLGARDDGTSVCDPDGRVWGVHGVLVAGNSVIPTALVANSTLAGAVTAVRAGRAAAGLLGDVSSELTNTPRA